MGPVVANGQGKSLSRLGRAKPRQAVVVWFVAGLTVALSACTPLLAFARKQGGTGATQTHPVRNYLPKWTVRLSAQISNEAHARNDSPQDASRRIQAVIQQAGNADNDELRLDYLRKLQKRPGLDASLREDLAKLITQIDRWLHEERLSYFGREVGRKKDFDFQDSREFSGLSADVAVSRQNGHLVHDGVRRRLEHCRKAT